MNFIIDFKNITPLSIYGGKASKLAELFQAGFKIPFGAVVLPTGFELFLDENLNLQKAVLDFNLLNTDENYNKIQNALIDLAFPEKLESELKEIYKIFENQGIKSLAIRSSGSLEDGVLSSFAGQFETFLNIQSYNQLKDSIIKCWSSIFGKKVIIYCKNNGISFGDLAMSIVIQQQIFSDFSGVVFTVNPLTGNDKQIIIEAVNGIGEALVQGSIIPDSYSYNWYEEKIDINSFGQQTKKLVATLNNSGLDWVEIDEKVQLLSNSKITELGEVCLKIQQFYGEPLDIEWAIYNDEIYILQARPLTSIHFLVDYEWTTADLKDGGISSSNTTPMMFSLYEYIFENTMPKYFESIHILPKQKFDKWFNWWFGFSYWNMLAAKEGVKQIPGFVERNFDKSLGIEPDYEGDGHVTKFTLKSIIKGIPVLIATNRSIAKRSKFCKTLVNSTRDYFEILERFYEKDNSFVASMEFFEDMIFNKYLEIEGGYFLTIYDNSNAATFCQESIDKANKKRSEKINYLNLVAGLSNLSHLRPSNELWQIANSIKKDSDAINFYSNQNPKSLSELINSDADFPMKLELLKFITKYKYHSLKELDLQVSNWDEDPSQVLDLLFHFISNDKIINPKESNKKQNEIYLGERKKLKSNSLNKKLSMHRHLLWWREELRDYSSKMYYHIRKVLLIVGEKMVEQDLLDEVDDVFFLKFQEVIDYSKTRDKNLYKKLIEKNKIFFESYRNFQNPNEIWQKKDFQNRKINSVSGENTFQGTAGAQGIITAKAVVIESIFEADKITDGCILVTKCTDPAWTIYFARISGLVTESGGMLSHGAVVSREYGIPAILGINNITSIIKTGDMIEVDGGSGIVNILKND